MTIKTRLVKLEKQTKGGNEQITVSLIGEDPNDPAYLIIDPHGPSPRRITKAEHEAEIKALRAAGQKVITVGIDPERI